MAVHLFPDVSNNQAVINGAQAKAQGMSAIAAKVSEGTGFVDKNAGANYQQAQANGLPFMAYHFMDSGNGTAQAQHFIQCVQNACGTLNVALCLDREGGGAADVDAFIREVRALAPNSPFCAYSAAWADSSFGTSGELATLPLWWSNYVGGSGDPHALLNSVTPGWFQPFGGFTHYTARQYSSSANVANIGGCDISVCFDDASFNTLFGVGVAPAPAPPPPPPEESTMLFLFQEYVVGDSGPLANPVYVTDGVTVRWVQDQTSLNDLRYAMQTFAHPTPMDATIHPAGVGYHHRIGVMVGPEPPA